MVRSPLRLLVFVVCAALFAGACARRGGRTAGAREQRQLLQQASRELGCRREGLVLTPLTERVVQVHGCGQLRDYAWASRGRRGQWMPIQPVALRASAELGCATHQLHVEAPAATVRSASGCGRSARYDLVCGSVECAWMMTAQSAGWGPGAVATAPPMAGPPVSAPPVIGPPVGTAPPVVAAAPGTGSPGAAAAGDDAIPPPPGAEGPGVAAASPDDGLVIPEPPAHGSPEALLRALLDQRRADIHRCAGVGVIPVRASWTEAGVVSLSLDPPLTGSAAEACVRAAVVPPPVPSGSAGEIVHPVL